MIVGAKFTDTNDLTFKSAVVIMCGLNYQTTGKNRLQKITGYAHSDIQFIFHNLRANGIIFEGLWNLDIGNDETNWMELLLCSMAGGGEIIRQSEDQTFLSDVEEKPISWNDLYKVPYNASELSLLPIKEEIPIVVNEPEEQVKIIADDIQPEMIREVDPLLLPSIIEKDKTPYEFYIHPEDRVTA